MPNLLHDTSSIVSEPQSKGYLVKSYVGPTTLQVNHHFLKPPTLTYKISKIEWISDLGMRNMMRICKILNPF